MHHLSIFKNCGIVHRVSCPHTYQQQGSIERKHRHVVETGLSLLSLAHMPLRFWDDAFQTACYLINRLPTPILQNKSPFEKLFNSVPNYLFLKTFGCACWSNLRPYNSHKLQPCSHHTSDISSETSPTPETVSTTNPSHSSSHPMITRSKNNITKPKLLLDGMIRCPLPKALLAIAQSSISETEPTCFTTAAKSHAWRQAMNLEFDALLKNQTWTLVPLHNSQNIIGCKWVFRIKHNADGSVERHKLGWLQRAFINSQGLIMMRLTVL